LSLHFHWKNHFVLHTTECPYNDICQRNNEIPAKFPYRTLM
jgi:hypothetical protein